METIEYENRGRQFEIDILKFLAIPFMICIHVYEQFGAYAFEEEIPDTVFRNVIEFLGGPLAAPVFMFCMGIGMVYTKHDSASEFMRRGLKLLTMGYALNFMRQTLPQLIGMAVGITADLDIIGGLLCVDILPFAGMAFLTVGLMKKANASAPVICAIAVVFQAGGIWATKLNLTPGVFQNLLGLLVPTGQWTSFPLTLWLVYPAAGMVFGEQLRSCRDKAGMYKKLLSIMPAFFLAYTTGLVFIGFDIRLIFALYNNSYYHHNIIGTLWILPIIISLAAVFHLAFSKKERSRIGAPVRYCSINLNRIYIIQWLIIAYSVAASMVIGIGKTYSPPVIIGGGIAVTVVSVLVHSALPKVGGKLPRPKVS